MEPSRLSRDDWMRAARLALLDGGPSAVRVEKLARDLGVTKGSFYWHFGDLAELMEGLLSEWEAESALLLAAMREPGAIGVRGLVEQISENVFASERGEVPSDLAIFTWAAVSPDVAERVNRAEAERIALLAQLCGRREDAEIAYAAYLGFILRRRRAPNSERVWALIREFMIGLLDPEAEETAASRLEPT